MRILLVNQGHTDNLGDRAIAQVMTAVTKKATGADIVVMPFIPDEQPTSLADMRTEVQPVSSTPDELPWLRRTVWRTKRFIRDMKSAPVQERYARLIRASLDEAGHFDAAIIGGGELIKGNGHPFFHSLQAWIDALAERSCPVAVMGVSSDARFTGKEAAALREAFAKCATVLVRDEQTLAVMHDILCVDAVYAPDVVFAYRYLQSCLPLEQRHSEDDAVRRMRGACVYAYQELSAEKKRQYTRDEYYEMWYRLIQKQISDDGEDSAGDANLKLLYTTYTDYCESARFREWLSTKKSMQAILAEIDSIDDYVDELADCQNLVSGRMHAMILALQYGVEVDAVPIKTKLAVFKEEWERRQFAWDQDGKSIADAYARVIRDMISR
ncbi:polysaccharide pyruvyl transferase family protein [Bifidobacterium sp. SO4]|uniref:polysaccharide pyruvyl transferase family protein n=1 Tax=Bifidobacterium sp. SO4 TaxID=2809030 RepID=UPI001BDBB9A2|nr:polysaccharide pyruvyl transferase family protein [Bifidobacterium sp. SO4]MBT1169961.1 polysaccharide pyruvyl transferase family protein [Bifidobacterium sp. SO4]